MTMETTPKTRTRIDAAAAAAMLRTMQRARFTEERLIRLYHQGKIFGGVYTGLGQEAIGAATAHASAPEDLFAPAIRDLTVHMGRGATVLSGVSEMPAEGEIRGHAECPLGRVGVESRFPTQQDEGG